MRNGIRVWALAVAALLAGAGSARSELIVNGGFEMPALAPGTGFVTLTGGAIPGWTIAPGTVDLIRDYWPAFQGNQSLDLVGDSGPGTAIAQSFATDPGAPYLLTFAYANNVDTTTATGRVEVIGSSTLINDLVTHSGSTRANMNYLIYSQAFVANSATTTLRFTHVTSGIPGFSGLALDAVSVQGVVPEPSTFVLAGISLVGFAGLAWRRRRAR